MKIPSWNTIKHRMSTIGLLEYIMTEVFWWCVISSAPQFTDTDLTVRHWLSSHLLIMCWRCRSHVMVMVTSVSPVELPTGCYNWQERKGDDQIQRWHTQCTAGSASWRHHWPSQRCPDCWLPSQPGAAAGEDRRCADTGSTRDAATHPVSGHWPSPWSQTVCLW